MRKQSTIKVAQVSRNTSAQICFARRRPRSGSARPTSTPSASMQNFSSATSFQSQRRMQPLAQSSSFFMAASLLPFKGVCYTLIITPAAHRGKSAGEKGRGRR